MKKLFSFLLLAALALTGSAGGADSTPLGRVATVLTATSEPAATLAQTSLGSAVADAVLSAASADIAIINGGDFYANLQPGEVFWDDVHAVFTVDRPLAVALVTYDRLEAILEHAVGAVTVTQQETIDRYASADGRFPQIAGFSFTYDASAPAGGRIVSITDSQGNKLDADGVFSLAATEYMLSGGYGYEPVPYMPAGQTLSGALGGYILRLGVLDEDSSERIRVIGVRDRPLIGALPLGSLLAAAIIVILFAVKAGKRQ